MIIDLMEGNYEAAIPKLIGCLITFIVVLIAVLIDLHYGITKSRAKGVYKHSYGMRQTVKKLKEYYSIMAFALLFEIISPLDIYIDLFQAPIFAILAAAALIRIEWLSVKEKSDEKIHHKLEEASKDLLTVYMKYLELSKNGNISLDEFIKKEVKAQTEKQE